MAAKHEQGLMAFDASDAEDIAAPIDPDRSYYLREFSEHFCGTCTAQYETPHVALEQSDIDELDEPTCADCGKALECPANR